MLKDRYQSFLNNALGCRTGAALRTELGVISKIQEQSKESQRESIVAPESIAVPTQTSLTQGAAAKSDDEDYDAITYQENEELAHDIEEIVALYENDNVDSMNVNE